MTPQLQPIDKDVFTISGLFSRDECAALIARAESIGFEPAAVRTAGGPKLMTQIRNNDRVELNEAGLSGEMWRRTRSFLPILDGCCACGVDSWLRLYRYRPGQEFKPHKDGVVTNALGQTSKLSYLIYLNDDCEGGATTFQEYRNIDGQRHKFEQVVKPVAGMALLFRHARWHAGTPVTAGCKYVLRSDVFYFSRGQ